MNATPVVLPLADHGVLVIFDDEISDALARNLPPGLAVLADRAAPRTRQFVSTDLIGGVFHNRQPCRPLGADSENPSQ